MRPAAPRNWCFCFSRLKWCWRRQHNCRGCIQLKRITTLDGDDASSLASLVELNHRVVRQFFEQVHQILGIDLLATLSNSTTTRHSGEL